VVKHLEGIPQRWLPGTVVERRCKKQHNHGCPVDCRARHRPDITVERGDHHQHHGARQRQDRTNPVRQCVPDFLNGVVVEMRRLVAVHILHVHVRPVWFCKITITRRYSAQLYTANYFWITTVAPPALPTPRPCRPQDAACWAMYPGSRYNQSSRHRHNSGR